MTPENFFEGKTLPAPGTCGKKYPNLTPDNFCIGVTVLYLFGGGHVLEYQDHRKHPSYNS